MRVDFSEFTKLLDFLERVFYVFFNIKLIHCSDIPCYQAESSSSSSSGEWFSYCSRKQRKICVKLFKKVGINSDILPDVKTRRFFYESCKCYHHEISYRIPFHFFRCVTNISIIYHFHLKIFKYSATYFHSPGTYNDLRFITRTNQSEKNAALSASRIAVCTKLPRAAELFSDIIFG